MATYEATGKGHKLGYTSSPKAHEREMMKTGWKKGEIQYKSHAAKKSLEKAKGRKYADYHVEDDKDEIKYPENRYEYKIR